MTELKRFKKDYDPDLLPETTIPREKLKTLKKYIEEGKSIREISRITKIDRQTIKYRLAKVGIKSKYKHGERPKEFTSKWFQGHSKTSYGYKIIKLRDHPFADKQGYVREHRLIMEKHLKRFLKPEEIVHHIDKDRLNNKLNNLMLFPNNSAHTRFHMIINRCVRKEEDLK